MMGRIWRAGSVAILLLTGCAVDDLKKSFHNILGSEDSNSPTPEINTIVPEASRVIDLGCPHIVQAYTLTSNAVAMAKLAATLGVGNLDAAIGAHVEGHATGPGNDIPTTTRLAAKQLNWLPMDVERSYGESEHKKFEINILPRNDGSEKDYEYAGKILKDVSNSIEEKHDYNFTIYILRESGTKAISFPGGLIYIEQGLLNPKFKSKAYFAVAHEMAHTLRRHETKEIESIAIDSVTEVSDLYKLVSNPAGHLTATLQSAKKGKKLFSKHFSDQELEADSCATRMMVKMFPEPGVASKALREFEHSLGPVQKEEQPQAAKVSGGAAPHLDEYAATVHDLVNSPFRQHPNTVERQANIERMYALLSAPVPMQEQNGVVPKGVVKSKH
jgi:hypothetical protein